MPVFIFSHVVAYGQDEVEDKYHGELMSLDVQDVPVEQVLKAISELAGINIVLKPSVHGRTTLKVKDVPWDQLLETVLIQEGLMQLRRGNVILIFPVEETEQVLRSGQ